MKKINMRHTIKISLIIAFLILLSVNTIMAQVSVKDLFRQANENYEKAVDLKKQDGNDKRSKQLFEEAKSTYLKLINDDDCRNAYVYYNLGNSSYQLGLIGEAIYYYRIARQFDPGFDDARINLNQARKQVKGYIEDESESNITKALFFWHYSTGVRVRLIVGIVAFVLVWIAVFMLLFTRKRFVIMIIIALSVISIAIFSSVLVQYLGEKRMNWGVITSSSGVIARKGPGDSYEPRFVQSLNEGIEFDIIEKDEDWIKIRLRNNEIAWIPEKPAMIHKELTSFK